MHSVTVSRLLNVSSPLVHTSLKREMRAVSEECGLQPVTLSMAFVYFEKLVLQGRLNKQNRKLVAAACVLLAAKVSSDLRKPEVKQLIDVSEFSTHTDLIVGEWKHKTGHVDLSTCHTPHANKRRQSGKTCNTCWSQISSNIKSSFNTPHYSGLETCSLQ